MVCKGPGLIAYTQSTHITPKLPFAQWPGIIAVKQVCLTSSPLSMCWVNPARCFGVGRRSILSLAFDSLKAKTRYHQITLLHLPASMLHIIAKGFRRVIERSVENDFRVTSCSTGFGKKMGFTGNDKSIILKVDQIF